MHVGPRGRKLPKAAGPVLLALSRSPSSLAPSFPQTPSSPAFPPPTRGISFTGGLVSPEGTLDLPENATIFNVPGASPGFSEPPDSNPVNEESRPGSPRSEPNSKPASQAGRPSPTDGGHGLPCPGPAASLPLPSVPPGRRRPGNGGPGREREPDGGEDELTAGERAK